MNTDNRNIMAAAKRTTRQVPKVVSGTPKPLRYVIYLRKSSEGQDAQAQSIPDQFAACEQMVLRDGLLVVGKPIEESASAWTSNNRPKFNQMLQDITDGKYDGIISYHPDRLSRNMLESGMVMDMLDSDIIKDLKFPTLHFSNDSSGKLLLNILFAMAKNYTDHQSEVVQRGIDSNLEKGKSSGVHKWGYIRDEVTGYYEPDPDTFPHIKHGWDMRVAGKTLDEVVDYWKLHNVHRMTKITRKNKKVRKIVLNSKQTASNLFHDPFYFGILVQKEQEVDLRLVVPGFQPMVDEDTYNLVQDEGQERSRVRLSSSKKRATFYPLRGMVSCGVCGGPMYVGPYKSGGGKRYLGYRCDNKACERSTKTVRAKYIFEPLYEVLGKLKLTAKEYDKYSKYIDQFTDEKLQELRIEKRSLTGALTQREKARDDKSRQYAALPEGTPQTVRDTLIQDLEDLENAVIDTKEQLDAIESKLIDPAKVKLAKEEFLNLSNSLLDKMMAGTPVEKDILCRALFLNVTLDNEKAPSFIWKEPFATMVVSQKVKLGARERT